MSKFLTAILIACLGWFASAVANGQSLKTGYISKDLN